MDKVELLKTSLMYLNELGYEFDKDTSVIIKNNILNFITVKYDINDNNYYLNVDNIKVTLSKNNVEILDTFNSYLNVNYDSIKKKKRNITPVKKTITKISFSKRDNRVIKSYNKSITNINNNKIENKFTNTYSKIIEVENDFNLLKEFPKEKKNKILIKE